MMLNKKTGQVEDNPVWARQHGGGAEPTSRARRDEEEEEADDSRMYGDDDDDDEDGRTRVEISRDFKVRQHYVMQCWLL